MLTAAAIAVVGFLLGAIMSLHRSIWPSVVAHGLFDATSFALLPWAMQNLEPFKQLQHVGG
jgi:membrane protease YdiL (CAAX protease family)